MKKVLFSIPCHQFPESIEHLVSNIQKFVPNCYVVLHLAGDSGPIFYRRVISFAGKYKGFLFINPTRYYTYSPHDAGQVKDLSTVHRSNFEYFCSLNIPFDIISLDTSNDLFVRRGVENSFNNYDCGLDLSGNSVDNCGGFQESVDLIKKVMPNIKYFQKNPQEGSFYPRDVFAFIARKVKEIEEIIGKGLSGEEIYLPTIAVNEFPELYKNNCEQYVFHNMYHSEVAREDIHKVRNGEMPFKYVVKRVPRDPNNGCRLYLKNLLKND